MGGRLVLGGHGTLPSRLSLKMRSHARRGKSGKSAGTQDADRNLMQLGRPSGSLSQVHLPGRRSWARSAPTSKETVWPVWRLSLIRQTGGTTGAPGDTFGPTVRWSKARELWQCVGRWATADSLGFSRYLCDNESSASRSDRCVHARSSATSPSHGARDRGDSAGDHERHRARQRITGSGGTRGNTDRDQTRRWRAARAVSCSISPA